MACSLLLGVGAVGCAHTAPLWRYRGAVSARATDSSTAAITVEVTRSRCDGLIGPLDPTTGDACGFGPAAAGIPVKLVGEHGRLIAEGATNGAGAAELEAPFGSLAAPSYDLIVDNHVVPADFERLVDACSGGSPCGQK